MTAKRIIPCLDVDDGRVVKGVRFQNLRDAGDPAELAAFYDQEGADEVVFLDITASSDDRGILLDAVARTAAEVFIPLTVGGGVRSVDDMGELLTHGADKVSVNTAALADPDLITRCAEMFGSQCVVLAIDARRRADGPGWEVFTHGGRRPTGRDAVERAALGEKLGAGEVLLTSMDRDGTENGYDLDLVSAVSSAVRRREGWRSGDETRFLQRSRPGRGPGRRHRAGFDARLHGRGGVVEDARHRAGVVPLAHEGALGEGGDLRQPHGHRRDPGRLRRRRGAPARKARGSCLPHRGGVVLLQRTRLT